MKLLGFLLLTLSLAAFAYGDEASEYDRRDMPQDSDYESRDVMEDRRDEPMDQNKPMMDDDEGYREKPRYDDDSYEKPMDDDYNTEDASDY